MEMINFLKFSFYYYIVFLPFLLNVNGLLNAEESQSSHSDDNDDGNNHPPPPCAKTFLKVYDHSKQRIFSTYNEKTQSHLQHIFIELVLNNQTAILDLHLNDILLLPNYVERTSTGVVQTNHTSSNCYYIGRLLNHRNEVVRDAHVAVSTCSGLRGCLMMSNDTIDIRPVTDDLNGEHEFIKLSTRIFKFQNANRVNKAAPSDPSNHGDGDVIRNAVYDDILRKRKNRKLKRALNGTVNRPYDSNNETLIVELFVTNDRYQYINQGENLDATFERTKLVVNIVNSIYRQLNIYIALVGVEVWHDMERIAHSSNAAELMNQYLKYRADFLNSVYANDNAQLITGRNLGEGIVGKAPMMSMCSWGMSGAINVDHSPEVGKIAATMAHEMGHNFGLQHDNENSGCVEERCIMTPASGEFVPTRFSQSSREQMRDVLDQGMHHCLHNYPLKIFGGNHVCGNGFVDEGEECDCGLPEDCTSKCCDPHTCKLLFRAFCSTGECCDIETCQLKPATTECRGSRDECDVGEYCDGVSEFCPFDVYKHNGYPCYVTQGQSFCYYGRCRTHDTQCKKLWGVTGQQSIPQCYDTFNSFGDEKGNCGFSWENNRKYIKCNASDVMCGLLQCQHSSEKMMFWDKDLAHDHYDGFINVGGKRHDCKSVMLDIDIDADNPGLVPDGATCGYNKMCVSQKCVDVSGYIDDLKCPNCHNRGVCTNIGQCHCDEGYAPPLCDKNGGGGSLHSNAISNKSNVGAMVGISIFVFIIFPCLLIVGILLYKRKHQLMKRLALGKYRSVSRPALPPRGEPVTQTYQKPPPPPTYFQQQYQRPLPLPSLPATIPPPPAAAAAAAAATTVPPSSTLLSSSSSFSKPPNSKFKGPNQRLQSSSSFSPSSLTKPSIEIVKNNTSNLNNGNLSNNNNNNNSSSNIIPPGRPPRLPNLGKSTDRINRPIGDVTDNVGNLKTAINQLKEIDFLNPKPRPQQRRIFKETALPGISKSDDDDDDDDNGGGGGSDSGGGSGGGGGGGSGDYDYNKPPRTKPVPFRKAPPPPPLLNNGDDDDDDGGSDGDDLRQQQQQQPKMPQAAKRQPALNKKPSFRPPPPPKPTAKFTNNNNNLN